MEATFNLPTLCVWRRATAVIVAVAAVVIVFLVHLSRNRTRTLRAQFGPEYDRLVGQQHGDRARAEAILQKRQKRIRGFHIRPLSPEQISRFAAEWRRVQEFQELFVDDPRGALLHADTLVSQALAARGYPREEFEQRAADISVQHPRAVESYRIAHDIATHVCRGETTTENLREAMQHYRRVFEDILQIHVTQREEVHR